MPNHVTNILTIEGNSEYVKKIREEIKSDKDIIDFNKIVPMPPSLSITSGSLVDQAIKSIKNGTEFKYSGPDREKSLKEAQIAIDNVKKYGHKDWHDWCCANWGTKWGAYSISNTSENSITFDTAWSSPEPIIVELSRKYPEASFKLGYADEDIGSNCGSYICENGEIVEFDEFERGVDSLLFALSIKGYDLNSILYNVVSMSGEDINKAIKYILNESSLCELIDEMCEIGEIDVDSYDESIDFIEAVRVLAIDDKKYLEKIDNLFKKVRPDLYRDIQINKVI